MTRNAVPDLQAGAIRSFSCAMSVATSGLNGASGPDWLLKVLRRLTPTGRDLHLLGAFIRPTERFARSLKNQYGGFRQRQHLVCHTAD